MFKKILDKYFNKNINSLLDKYYTDKVIDLIMVNLHKYALESKYEVDKKTGRITFSIKMFKFKENYYKFIYAFRPKDSLELLQNIKEVIEEIDEKVTNYFVEGK